MSGTFVESDLNGITKAAEEAAATAVTEAVNEASSEKQQGSVEQKEKPKTEGTKKSDFVYECQYCGLHFDKNAGYLDHIIACSAKK